MIEFGHNGWAILLAPGGAHAVHTVRANTRGTVTVWHRAEEGWNLVEVQAGGLVQIGQGATQDEARAGLRRVSIA